MSDLESILLERLKQEEGFHELSYHDDKQWSWGYGTPAPGPDRKISKMSAEVQLKDEIRRSLREFRQVFGEMKINKARTIALVDMIFNLGKPTFLHFKNMLRHVHKNEWKAAAFEAYNSRWYDQVSRRSKRIVRELAYGKTFPLN